MALAGSERIDENGGGTGVRLRKRHQKGKAHRSAGDRNSTKDGGVARGRPARCRRLGPGLATTDTDPCARAFRVVCNLAAASYMPR